LEEWQRISRGLEKGEGESEWIEREEMKKEWWEGNRRIGRPRKSEKVWIEEKDRKTEKKATEEALGENAIGGFSWPIRSELSF
jgi:hypothetical protein